MSIPRLNTRIYILCVLLLIISLRSNAQSLLPESPVASSLSNATIGLRESQNFSVNPSQSRADSATPLHAAITFTPFVGGLKDANQGAFEGTYYSSMIRSSFSVGVTNLSYSDIYSDLAINLSLARTFELANSRKASAGLRLRYEILGTTPQYPKLHFLFIDVGFTFDLTTEFSLGGAALNLLGAKYAITNGETEDLGRRFLLGIAYHPLEIPLKLLTSIDKDRSIPLSFQFGVEYSPTTFLAIRLGTSTDTGNITTGIGIFYGGISFDVGSRFDKALGSIFSFGISGAW